MKAVKTLITVAMLGLSIGATVMSNSASAAVDLSWLENSVGPFDAISISQISGGTFASPAMTLDSGATNWVLTNNPLNAFASFNASTNVYFSSHQNSPGSFAFFAWYGSTLVDSALITNGNVTQFTGVTPTRAVAFASAAPEPETYAMIMAGLGLLVFIARSRKAV